MASRDLDWARLSEAGPWTIELEALAWRRGLAGVRAACDRLAPLSDPDPLLAALRGSAPRCGTSGARSARGTSRSGAAGARRRSPGCRAACAWSPRGSAPPTSSWADHRVGDGIFPAELVAESSGAAIR